MVRRQKVVRCGWSLGIVAKDGGDFGEEVARHRRNRLDSGVVVNLSPMECQAGYCGWRERCPS